MIVGTDLKQIERVTGRLTTGRVLLGGALSGVWIGVFVGLVFAVFEGGEQFLVRMLSAMIIGAFFGLVWGWLGYKATGGQRDFTSVSQVVATRYEVLVEHRHVQQARELLAEHDPMRAAVEKARIMREEADRAAARAARDARPPAGLTPEGTGIALTASKGTTPPSGAVMASPSPVVALVLGGLLAAGLAGTTTASARAGDGAPVATPRRPLR